MSIIRQLRARVFDVIVSEALLAEYRKVLTYPHLQQRHQYDEQRIREFVDNFRKYGQLVHPGFQPSVVTADPDDDIFIACAVAGEADYIVSGDRHLLNLGEYQGIHILRPADFLAILET
jgi:putative PIN family toxin of toxin-antitoxin system